LGKKNNNLCSKNTFHKQLSHDNNMKYIISLFAIALLCGTTNPALAADGVNGADTAWVLTSTALVLFMTLPGLALFYGGLVQAKNVLSVMMHCVAIAAVVSILWFAIGYSLAFDTDGSAFSFIGGLNKAFMLSITRESTFGSLPEIVFAMFQMTFAIITPALIVGTYVERIRFGAVLLFSSAWLLLVYAPVTYWIWGGGWLNKMGIMDFAGGLVVHATAGAAAIVVAITLGRRKGFPSHLHPPHNPSYTAMGAGMLWVGWFGFNGGSALIADASAGMALTATHLAAATGTLCWIAIEWIKFGKPSVVGAVTGTIAGLATVTPAAGFIHASAGILLGLAGGVICFIAVEIARHKYKLDDSLDVFAVHGVGGIIGTLMAAFLALPTFQGYGINTESWINQLGVQALGVVATLAWSGIISFILIKICAATVGLRVTTEEETDGLDLAEHGERGYAL
jgi:Amt family ammonium transporter